jgi:hypothetical protein
MPNLPPICRYVTEICISAIVATTGCGNCFVETAPMSQEMLRICSERVETSGVNPCQLRKTANQTLGCSMLRADDLTDASFHYKVGPIRDSTAESPLPTSSHATCRVCLPDDAQVTTTDMLVIGRLSNKASAADPIPTSAFITISDLANAFVAKLFNHSFSTGH